MTPVRWGLAVLALADACWRLARWRGSVGGFLERGRQGRLLATELQHPEWFGWLVWRLGRWLPPARMGSCLRRSLLLYDLWQRCGVQAVLHIGVQVESGRRRAHAWLSCDRPELARYCGAPAATEPVVSYAGRDPADFQGGRKGGLPSLPPAVLSGRS